MRLIHNMQHIDKVKNALKNLKTSQAMIPGGLTSALQPLDVDWNKPFKDQLRQKWFAWMALEGDKPVTKGGKIKEPGLSLVFSWVKSVWNDIPEDMVKKSSLKTSTASTLDRRGMTNFEMTTLIMKVIIKLKASHLHGMLIRTYHKKIGTNCLRVIAATLITFEDLLNDFVQ